MNKLLGILPYIYFYDEPIHLGSITLSSLPDTKGRDFAPKQEADKACLQELIKCFPVSRGLESDKGVIRAFTYFLVNNPGKEKPQAQVAIRKAVTLLRYMMLRPDNQALNDLETSSVYTFELPPAGNDATRIYHTWINFNQEEWITPTHQTFYPPGWYVDSQIKHTSILEDLGSVNQQFYTGALDNVIETNILLAMEWYNYSFLKYSPRGLEGRLIDISIAFDTLFRLQENNTTLYNLDCTPGVGQIWLGGFGRSLPVPAG